MSDEKIHARIVHYSETEELANRFTHGLGALLSIVAVIALIQLASGQGDHDRLLSACIYGGAVITFYCLSTAYHSVKKPSARYVFRILDHIAIYIMIAGSYTPFALVTLRGVIGKLLFGTVWGLGVLGSIMKIFAVHRLRFWGTFSYVALGWIVLLVLKPLSLALAASGLTLLFVGGAAYTVGVVFYLWERLPFNHAIWHLFVLTGSACHFWAIFTYVTPIHM
ncbi:PAQR family membrane homeostasis protein TrhA [Geomonas sp.]|uniref:PAQR family membrane homeostasis protein TrhA n=1 Tax=Geomonas sp. TaxID=2651584 RepID=UPI002B482BED|nr:hemolysin III family protein [Geomonas sp.]HJV36458.1 hemolysin III family protein [Geomonas sp.]